MCLLPSTIRVYLMPRTQHINFNINISITLGCINTSVVTIELSRVHWDKLCTTNIMVVTSEFNKAGLKIDRCWMKLGDVMVVVNGEGQMGEAEVRCHRSLGLYIPSNGPQTLSVFLYLFILLEHRSERNGT